MARRRGHGGRGRDPRGAQPRRRTRRGTRRSPTTGLAVATWPVAYGGLDLAPAQAQVAEAVLAPYNLGRLNPLGLNSAAPALFAYGTEEQRLRFLPPLVRNEEKWCQLLSEPGAGSDLASLATRAVRDGDEWVARRAEGLDHVGARLRLRDLPRPHRPDRRRSAAGSPTSSSTCTRPGVDVRPLRHIGGEVDFNEVFLDGVRVPDAQRVGAVGEGWRVAGATLAGERQMVSGSGSGGVDRIGGSGIDRVRAPRGRSSAARADPHVRQRLAALVRRGADPRLDEPAGARRGARRRRRRARPRRSARCTRAGLNQRIQLLATDLLGADARWPGTADDASTRRVGRDACRSRSRGMLRSRANTIEGGTTEVNKNILGEKVLGLPREPDPYVDAPWEDGAALVTAPRRSLVGAARCTIRSPTTSRCCTRATRR